jgi:hypothetical protein
VSEIEPPRTEPPAVEPEPETRAAAATEPSTGVSLARVTWSVTTLVFVIAGAVLLAQAYYGYAVVTLVVAASAAVNLI